MDYKLEKGFFWEYYQENFKKYPLEFTHDAKKGYGLKATRAIQKGELVLVEQPFVSEQIFGHSIPPFVCR